MSCSGVSRDKGFSEGVVRRGVSRRCLERPVGVRNAQPATGTKNLWPGIPPTDPEAPENSQTRESDSNRGRELNPNTFFSNFSGASGYPGKIPGYPAKKV